MALNRTQKIGVAGGCIFIFSILFQTAIFPAVLNAQVKRKVALKRGWMMRDLWSKLPFPFEFHFYIFNITNPDEIKNGKKPVVQEVGPFVYDEWHEKTNLIDHEEDDTVSFTIRNTYYFNVEKSNGLSDEEEVTVPNYFILGLVNALLIDKPSVIPIVGKAIDSMFKKPDSIFIKAKIKDILFEGLIIDCNVNDFAGSAVCSEVTANYEDLRLKRLNENIYSMALWGPMNGTDSKGRIRVYRGITNIMDVGRVVEYDNKFNMSVWNDDYCDTFNGTDGTIFHPFFDKKGRDDMVAFNPNLCRSVSCHVDSKSRFAGLKTLRYTADLGTDGNNNPLHKCYCASSDKCLKKGVYDTYKCTGAPLIVSNPHFYMADPYYLEQVEGINPAKEKHMIFIELDPFTGAPVHAHTRAQFNMFITSVGKFKLMKNFPDALLPLLWIDEILILPDFLLKELKLGHKLYTLGVVYQYFMMFGGLGMAGFAGYKHYKSTKIIQKRNQENIAAEQTDDDKLNNSEKMSMGVSTIQTARLPPRID